MGILGKFIKIVRAAMQTPFFMLIVMMIIVSCVALILVIYLIRRVFKPIKQLTFAAQEISQGNIETEIGHFPDAHGEIGLLSQALHRMVEQFRLHAMNMEQAERETSIKSLIKMRLRASLSIEETFEELATILCEYFNVFKTTIVFIGAGKPTAFSNIDPLQFPVPMEEQFQIYDFLHLEQTESLLADRKLAFLNSYAIASHRISFLAPQTKSACFIPLREKTLLGFIILENNSTSATLSAGIESTMMYAAKIISEWLSWQEWTQDELDEDLYEEHLNELDEPHEQDEPGPPPVVMKFKNIDGLDVDSALADMGGLFDVYEQSVKLTARLLPETIDKMDECISEGNSKGFEIEIHGIKGVLRNIGAGTLGNKAAHLEKAVLSGEMDCCRDEYPAFRELLTEFMEQLNMAVKVEADKEKIDKETLLAALKTAKSAAESFDTMQALEAVSPLAGFSYNEEADELFEKVIFALEEFKCESALINIIKMEEMME